MGRLQLKVELGRRARRVQKNTLVPKRELEDKGMGCGVWGRGQGPPHVGWGQVRGSEAL